MKICPQCQTVYDDHLNFCLEDGLTLVDSGSYDPQRTLSYTGDPTAQYRQRPTNDQNYGYNPNQNTYGRQYQKTGQSRLLITVAAVFALLGITLAGLAGAYLLKKKTDPEIGWFPTPSPQRSATPSRTTPTPPGKFENIKVEIKDTVKTEFGQSYLKTIVTNMSNATVTAPAFYLTFYKKDIKIKDVYGRPALPYLKPKQSIPVWINLYGTDNYTSVKVKDTIQALMTNKPDEELYPKINLSETSLKAEKGSLMYNFRQLYKTFYKVEGIVENPGPNKVTAKLFALYYDEKGEIVGIKDTRLSDLRPKEKTKFEVSECEIDLFGKPKTFEIIAVLD